MAELEGDRNGGMRPDRSQDLSQRVLVFVGVKAEILGRNSALRRDRRRFEDHEPCAGQRQVAKVDHVPVTGCAI
jgi:hypothetical protein